MPGTDSSAQTTYTVAPATPLLPHNTQTKTGGKNNQPTDVITLKVRDSTVGYILRTIARQAKRAVVYDNANPQFSKRISVDMTKTSVMNAIATVLKGTGLIATAAPDGQTILVRPQTDSITQSTSRQETGALVGKVIDSATRSPIPGVTVLVVGTKVSALTSDAGIFRLTEVPVGEQSLSVRMLGYESRIIQATVESGKVNSSATIVLRQASTTLSEVVTTATGLQRRVEVSNDIAKVNVDELMQKAPARSVSDLLAVARIPGVEVTPSSGLPGSPSRIRLRGTGSVSRSNDPIVIVDGIRISSAMSTTAVLNQAARGTASASTLANNAYVSSRLDDIDPNSIETLEVVRGPSAAALYGTDAANGVIIITTKRGQAGKTHWRVGVDRSWNSTPGQYQPRYRAFGRNLINGFDNDCRLSEVFNFLCVIDSVSANNPRNRTLLTDKRSGRDVTYNASVGGGTQSIQYNIIVSHQDLLGPLTLPIVDRIRLRQLGESIPGWLKQPDQQKRNNFSTQLNTQPVPSLQVGLLLAVAQSNQQSGGSEFTINGAADAILPEDTLTYATAGLRADRERLTSNVTGGKIGITADWRALLWFVPNMTLGADRSPRTDKRLFTARYCAEAGCNLPQAEVSEFRGEQSVYTINLRSAFPLSLGRWERFLSLKPSVGVNLTKSLSSGIRVTGDSLALGSEDIATAAKRTVRPSLSENSAVGGWYADFRIGVLERFYTNMGFRRDVGSTLSERISAPTYPTIGTSWLISDEGFFPKNTFINSLQLRITYGHSARQPAIDEVRGGYQNINAIVNGQTVNGIYLTRLANFELRPERAVELEYGFNLGIFDDRATINLTIADTRNRNLLVTRDLSSSTGGLETNFGGHILIGNSEYTENISQVFNRSFELAVNGRVIDRPGLVWIVDMGLTNELNRVDRLGNGVLPFGTSDARIVEGYPLNGVWQFPIVSYNDVDKDGVLQPDEIVVGDTLAYVGAPYARYKMSYGTSLQLLNGRLTITGNFAYDGGVTQNQQRYDGWGFYDPASPLAEQALAQMTQRQTNENVGWNRQTISVVRFSNASISYTLPEVLARQFKSTSAMITFQGSNLGLWTQYRGRDPGVNSSPIGEKLTDNGATIPQPRKFAMALRLNF